MPGIIDFPKVVQDAVATYGDLFHNECQRRHVSSQKPGGNRSLRKPGMMLFFGHGRDARHANGLWYRDHGGATDSAGGSVAARG
jgi:hypothetical protein